MPGTEQIATEHGVTLPPKGPGKGGMMGNDDSGPHGDHGFDNEQEGGSSSSTSSVQ